MKTLRSTLVALSCCTVVSVVALVPAIAPDTPAPPEKITALKDAAPRWWKGNLHTHSFWSDGDDFPEMIADWYKQKGYDFLALTDHNILSDGEKWVDIPATGARDKAVQKYVARFGDGWVEQRTEKEKKQVRLKPLAEFRSVLEEPGKFLLIPGEEITHKFAKFPVHMNAINVRDVVKPIDGPSVLETIQVNLRQVAEQRKKSKWRTMVFLNHPNYGWGVRAEDLVAEEVKFFEVFNGHPSVRNYGDDAHASMDRVWDIVLALRLGRHKLPVVYGLATDDAHRYHEFGVGKVNPGRGWVMVRAPHLTAEAMVKAMEAGDFYASTGVTLSDVRRDGDRMTLTIKAEPGVKYHTQFIATMNDVSLDSEPKLDKDNKALDVTRVYRPEVGKVVAESDALTATYKLTGKELYVRAKIVSTRAHPNPYQKGDVETAWTQPVVP